MADPSTILKNAANAADARVAMMYPLVRVRSPARPALCGGPVTSEIGSPAGLVSACAATRLCSTVCVAFRTGRTLPSASRQAPMGV